MIYLCTYSDYDYYYHVEFNYIYCICDNINYNVNYKWYHTEDSLVLVIKDNELNNIVFDIPVNKYVIHRINNNIGVDFIYHRLNQIIEKLIFEKL